MDKTEMKPKKETHEQMLDAGRKGIMAAFRGRAAIFNDTEEYMNLPLGDIIVKKQVRAYVNTNDDAFLALKASIKDVGVINPITVVKDGDKYRIAAGERRYRACCELKLVNVPARIIEQDIMTVQLIENLQRENLDPMDEATAYLDYFQQQNPSKTLGDLISLLTEYRLAKDEEKKAITQTVCPLLDVSGKSAETIKNLLSLLKAPKSVQEALKKGQIGQTQGYIFAANADHPKVEVILNEVIITPVTNDALRKLFKEDTSGSNTKERKVKLPEKLYVRVGKQINTIRSSVEKEAGDLNKADLVALCKKADELDELAAYLRGLGQR